MKIEKYNLYFFFAILIGITLVTYFVFKPFLVAFIIAAILAHLFDPLYNKFLRLTKNRLGVSAGLSCLVIGLIIVLPLVTIALLVVNETQSMLNNYSNETGNIQQTAGNLLTGLSKWPIVKNFNPDQFVSQEQIAGLVTNFSQGALVVFQKTYQGVAHFIFVTFIMVFSLFYLFIDGKKMIKKIILISPLNDRHEKLLLERFSATIKAVIKGALFIGIIQGSLGAILFAFTGVKSPILLGIIMSISSLLPSIGSGLVWAPVGIIMIALGHFWEGTTIILVGALFISTIDNFIRPKLVGNDIQIHPLLILFSSLGGIAMFGITGFVIGPIIMSFFLSFWEIYLLEFKDELVKYNS